MRVKVSRSLFFNALLLSGVSCYVAALQAEPYTVPMYERNMELSVFSRADPTLKPRGINMGRFILSPRLETELSYNDNVFAEQTNEESDFIFSLQPNFRLNSDFERHKITLFMDAEQRLYREHSSENRLEYKTGTNIRYDLSGDVSVPFNISYEQLQVPRGNPDDNNLLEPTEYNILNAESGLLYSGHLFDIDALIKVRDFSYDDALTQTGIQNNQDRNRTETTGYFRFGLSSKQQFAPYVYTTYKDINYDVQMDDSGFNRSAEEIEGGIGATFRLSPLVSSRLQAGYTHYDPEDPNFEIVEDLNYHANITWEPTTLTAFTLTGSRGIEVTTLANQTASIDSSLKLGLTYELTPQIFLQPSIEFEQKSYEGSVNADLEQTNAGLRINYKADDKMWWSAEYRFTQQDDPDNSTFISEYDRNTFLISLRLQY